MKMGKAHLVGSLVMMSASIAYTIWSFSSGSAAPARVEPAPAIAGQDPVARTGVAPGTGVDPTTIPPVTDVALDRLPQWPRNPFLPVRAAAAETPVIEAAPVVETAPEAEIVLTGIMYAPPRRVAMINGHRYNVGDRIGNETLVDIQPNGVVLESPERGRRTIEKRRPGSSAGTARPGGAR